MKVTDEDVLQPMMAHIESAHLHLRTFTAVDHEMAILDHQILTRWNASVCRDRAAGTEDGELEQLAGGL